MIARMLVGSLGRLRDLSGSHRRVDVAEELRGELAAGGVRERLERESSVRREPAAPARSFA